MPSPLKFTKMHALGNDFVVIDGISQKCQPLPAWITHYADRHVGIGFDQLLLVEKSDIADFKYRIFNADGTEVSQCGNGARCLAQFLRETGLTDKTQLSIETRNGMLKLYLKDAGHITVDMGLPRLAPASIPFSATESALTYSLKTSLGEYAVGIVSMGNPHCVLRVDTIEHAPVLELGSVICHHPQFPEQTNVGFMVYHDAQHIGLRVYERGVGETLACGSGACAAVVWGRLQKMLEQDVRVSLPGGDVHVSWTGNPNDPVYLTGSAVTVFQGVITA